MKRPSVTEVLGALVLLLALPAAARVVEEEFDLPVEVRDGYGKAIAQPIRVTVFRDDAAGGPRPLAIINHGRASEAAERAGMGRARYSTASRWFVAQGFVVALPTRIGYGVSGGEDVEETGSCTNKRYAPGYAAAAQETLALLRHMQQRDDVLPERALVVGQSFGGATAIAVAAAAPAGVAAAINFAGGGGGQPKTHPGSSCAPHLMQRLYADYGRSARLPTLWLYAVNDRYFGSEYPRRWFEAFREAGGQGEFVEFPPVGEDGHSTFSASPATWQPVVAEFLRRQSYPVAAEAAK